MREEELIERLLKKVPLSHSRLIVSAGDDAAVWDWDETHFGLFSVDTLHDGFDFDKVYQAPLYIGYKAVTTAVSDICAMNGEPLFLSIALGIPRGVSAEYLEGVYEGIGRAAHKYGLAVMGGDISLSAALWLSVGVVGRVEKCRLTLRRGACPAEVICVSGDLGGAYAGLKILQREKAVYLSNPHIQPDVSSYNYIISRQIKPEARLDVVQFFRKQDIVPSSMLDLSDGLAQGLHALAKASGVGVRIFSDRLPYHEQTQKVAELFDQPLLPYLLYGGEEYELLFTVPPSSYEKLSAFPGLVAIGYIIETLDLLLEDPVGQIIPIEQIGWDSLQATRAPETRGES